MLRPHSLGCSACRLDVPLERHGMQTTRKSVPQHDFREGASLDSVRFHPREVKVGSVLPHQLCEPLLVCKECPSKGGGVAMFTPVLFQDDKDLARSLCPLPPWTAHPACPGPPVSREASQLLQGLPWAVAQETTLPP